MSLESWSANGWIDRHSASESEMTALIETAEHAVRQAEGLKGLSSAWKLKMAYDAILSCARAALFRPVTARPGLGITTVRSRAWNSRWR